MGGGEGGPWNCLDRPKMSQEGVKNGKIFTMKRVKLKRVSPEDAHSEYILFLNEY